MGKIVNQAELSSILGKTHTTLWEWGKEGMPVQKSGENGSENEYDTEDVIAWILERERIKTGKDGSQRDRLTRLQADAVEMDNKVKEGELVPASQIEPVWRERVLTAAAFMASRHSRLAAVLEAAPGIEAKRKVLKEEDAAFLTKLGVEGERMQAELDQLLQSFSEAKASEWLTRIAGHEIPPRSPGPD